MNINLIIQNPSKIKNIPTKKQFTAWIESALGSRHKKCEILIRIVDKKEITKINKTYRKKNKPTNIISFEFDPPPGVKTNFLGDLIICASVVRTEAKLQHKTMVSHWAHLTIHGTLHLLGYDHIDDTDAEEMENLEIKILKKLSFPNPYESIN